MKRTIAPSPLLIVAGVLALLVILVPSGMAEDPTAGKLVDTKDPGNGVVAYYFHGDFRCRTCLAIERQAHETITADFADELASGRLTWRALNVEQPGNEHFVEDFKLVTRSLVLVSYQDGKVQRFQNLDKVWQLVRDEELFSQYVRESTRAFLDEG
ncbi:MAG: hypothetical protein C3F15_12325 [Holophagae bacterium]|nr:MAG: hypothetical protein C3F15_12325 [Holophagae bacterium]